MSPFRFPLAMLSFFGVVAIAPVWVWFLNNHLNSVPPAGRFIAGLSLPGFVLLFIAGWLSA